MNGQQSLPVDVQTILQIMMVAIFIGTLVGVVVQIYFCLTIHNALSRVSEGNRLISPLLVWLLMVPVVNYFWIFRIATQVPGSLKNEFVDCGKDDGSDYGRLVGLTLAISNLVAFALVAVLALVEIPFGALLVYGLGILSLFSFITFWVKISGYSRKLAFERPLPVTASAIAKQIVLLIVFFCVLGSVFFLRESAAVTKTLDPKVALANYGFYLTEVSKQSGIDFVHQGPTLDAKLNHIMPIVAAMGASVSVVDFDRDGWPDLYVVNSAAGSKNRLYRNKHDGTFEDVAEQMSVADLNRPGDGACIGAIWGDFDNDGYEDLLVYRWGKTELFHNDAGKGFTRVTDAANIPKWLNAGTAIWLDFDGDGWLDLFIAGYWPDDIDLWNLKSTKVMPDSFQYASNGGRKYLLRNRGKDKNGNWLGLDDVTAKMGIKSLGWTLAAAATDLRGTGHPDLVLAVDYGVNEFYANQNGKGFVETGKQTNIGEKSKSGMNVSFGDIYNQGRFSIYISNITEPGQLQQWNNLWVPEPGRDAKNARYENLADQLGVARGGWSWGAQFGDLNNDGRIDLFLTNGYVSADRNHHYWYDYSKIAGGNTSIISDAARWPDMKGKSLGGYQQHCLWLNGGGKFDDVAAAVGVTDTFDGRAVVLVDLWNRGVLDVVQASQNGPLLVYKNTVAKDNAWIQFELEGTKSNTSAIGAQVKLYWNGQVQIQEVSGGNGYASQNQRRLHFGLGREPRMEKAVIRWPSGQTQTIDAPKIGVLHRVKEPA